MSIVYILLPIALLLGCGFLIAFIHASQSGQYDDLETPAHRILISETIHQDSKNRERKTHVV